MTDVLGCPPPCFFIYFCQGSSVLGTWPAGSIPTFRGSDPSSERTDYDFGYFGDLGESAALALPGAPVASPPGKEPTWESLAVTGRQAGP